MSEQTKACTKCGVIKPLTEFRLKKKASGNLRPASRCKDCTREDQREAWVKKGRPRLGWISVPYEQWTDEMRAAHLKRKEEARRKSGARQRKEIAAIAENNRKIDHRSRWEQNAKEAFDYWLKVRATDDQVARYWAASGEPWRNPRLSCAERYAMKYKLNTEFQLSERMRRQVNKAKKRDGIAEAIRGAIRRGGRSAKVQQELGYSTAELMTHIEKQFTKGMDWEKFKAGEIHIDHIIPQASFDLADDDEWRRCWCLSNLRPMWSKENLRKRDAILFLC